MRKIMALLTLSAFAFFALPAFAADEPAATKGTLEKPGINCCIKGKCNKAATEADCAKEGGKVMKDCKDCK